MIKREREREREREKSVQAARLDDDDDYDTIYHYSLIGSLHANKTNKETDKQTHKSNK